jgi:hypothetical protein
MRPPANKTLAELRKDTIAALLMLATVLLGAMLWSLVLS